MPRMTFADFTDPEVFRQFGLTRVDSTNLFADVPSVPPTTTLQDTLSVNLGLGTGAHTEFSRAVWLVGPVLADFWRRYAGRITLIGGAEFDADPDAGLTGVVDFLVSLAPHSTWVVGPVVLVIFEAKRDSIPDGLGQCVAGMVGADRFNRRAGTPRDAIYGCVTTGSRWKFLRLSGDVLTVDLTEYPLEEADRLLGILTHVVGPAPRATAA